MATPKTEDLNGLEGPGVSVKKSKLIDAAIDKWRDTVDARIALTSKEVEQRQKVLDLMHENGYTAYPYGDDKQVVLIPGKEKIKLKTMTESGDTDIDDD